MTFLEDPDVSDDHLTSADIEVLLLRHMPHRAWLTVPELYELVEAHGHLSSSDWEPDAPNSNGIRWRRNVRNVLQSRKSRVGRGGTFEWDPETHRYRTASRSAAPRASPGMRPR